MSGDEIIDPLIGAKIGPCLVEERLAAGGMGVVYRAKHSTLNQDVAVKILAPSLAADQEYVTRFFREAGAAGQIDHPNVIRVIDVGKFEDRYYLVMEFVAGDTLDRIIDTERRLTLEKATRFMREIASGLAAAHRAGIIHRDVKPGNIIVSPDGKTHLTDFGLARHAQTRKGLTVEGTFLGTPEYASPEQVEGRKLDHRTDLYSLGVTYYHMLSGTLPFLGESPMEMAIKRTKDEPRPLESAFAGADARASAITKKLLRMDPAQRYQSATDVIRDLDAILAGPKSVAGKAPETTKKVENVLVSAKTKRRIRMLIHWDLLVTAIAFAFLSGGLASRGGEFLERWLASDADFSKRVMLAGAALVAVVGAVLVYRKEISSIGRQLTLVGLMLLMLLGSLVAGAWIDRIDASGPLATAGSSVRALAHAVLAPVNRLALCLVALLAAVQVSFEREPGSHRVFLTRLLLVVAFPLAYAFGLGRLPWEQPFKNFMVQPELSIPLATATSLACFFGALLVTGYNFEGQAKIFGAVLCVGGAIGLYVFAVLVSQIQRPEAWTALIAEPLQGLGRPFRESGTLLAVVLALGVFERSIAFAGMKQQERVYRRRF